MKYLPIDTKLFIENRQKFIKQLKPNSMAIFNSNDEMPRNGDQNFPFKQNSDMFNLKGIDQEKCILCICPDHPLEPYREVVFTLKTNETMVTWYGHLLKPAVKDKNLVKRGTIIGYVGNSGRSTGSHLHYSVFLNGVPVNPRKYLN